jgi:hypothetical protein
MLPALLVIAAAALACERKELAPGVTDSTFVGAMAGLRRLPASAMVDSASRKRARDSILRRYQVAPFASGPAGRHFWTIIFLIWATFPSTSMR